MLYIEHLTKTFGEKKAVDDLSLHIAPGEIYGFIGHNGAGKTTTIKCCAGILQFEQGEIYIDGKSVKADPLGCKQQLAYIPDNPDLYEFLSGVKYLNFVADIFGVSKTDREARIEKYADLFDLTGDLAQPISAYSHGMKQKLAIISALLHDPKLIIMDEPFVGLDPKAAHILDACGDELPVWSGNDDLTVPLLSLGAKGVISVLSNVRPKRTLQMVRACQAGDYAAAGRMQVALTPLIDALFSEINPIPVKQALSLMEIPAGLPRLPLTPLSATHLPALERALSAAPEP